MSFQCSLSLSPSLGCTLTSRTLSFLPRALHVSMLYGGPAHIKLVAEWEPEVKARVFGVVSDEVPEPHCSVVDLQRLYQQPLTASLDDCLKIYTKEETVSRVATLADKSPSHSLANTATGSHKRCRLGWPLYFMVCLLMFSAQSRGLMVLSTL